MPGVSLILEAAGAVVKPGEVKLERPELEALGLVVRKV